MKGLTSGIQLLTTQTLLMFLLAVFYDLQGPSDDRTCKKYTIKSECIKQVSYLDHTQTYCTWDNSNLYCNYNDPSFTWSSILIIGVVVSMFTAIINTPLDYFFELINSPTLIKKTDIVFKNDKIIPEVTKNAYTIAESSFTNVYNIIKNSQTKRRINQYNLRSNTFKDDKHILRDDEYSDDECRQAESTDNELLNNLLIEIKYQRNLLKDDEINNFDLQWGIDSSGKMNKNIENTLYKEIEDVKLQSENIIVKFNDSTNDQNGLQLLHIFIMDILGRGTKASRIFEKKSEEDYKTANAVSEKVKGLAWCGIICMNMFFMYFTIIKGYVKGIEWQFSFLVGSITQLLMEVLLFETFECMWVNYIIPSLVFNEVSNAYKIIHDTIEQICNIDKADERFFLNMPAYLFISTNIAKNFPDMLESTIISAYQNYLPGELYKKWNDRSSNLNIVNNSVRIAILSTIINILQIVGTSPFILQKMVIRLSQPVILAGICVAFDYIFSSAIYSSIFAIGLFGIIVYMVRSNSVKTINSKIMPLV